MALSLAAFPAHLINKVISITIGVAIAVGVIATAAAVGSILGKTEPGENTLQTTQSFMKIALDRFISQIELPEFYDKRETLHNLIKNIERTLNASFSPNFVKIIVHDFTHRPKIISENERNTTIQSGQPSLVIINATAYFVRNYTATDIYNSMRNFSEWVVLRTKNNQPSGALANISLARSIFTDTIPCDYTVGKVKELRQYDIPDEVIPAPSQNVTHIPYNTTTTPSVSYPSTTTTSITSTNLTDPATTTSSFTSTNSIITESPHNVNTTTHNNHTTPTESPFSVGTTSQPISSTVTENPSDTGITSESISSTVTENPPNTGITSESISSTVTENLPNTEITSQPIISTVTEKPSDAETTFDNNHITTDGPTMIDSTTTATITNSPTDSCQFISLVNMVMIVKRSMRNDELLNFYNLTTTFEELSTNLTALIILQYSNTFIKLIITDISDAPYRLTSGDSNVAAVTISGEIYFGKNITLNEITELLNSYAPMVTLTTSYGYPSSNTGGVSSLNLSINYAVNLTQEQSRFYMCYPITSLINSSTNIQLCNTAYKTDVNIAMELFIDPSLLTFAYNNLTAIYEVFIQSINEHLLLNYPQSFVRFQLTTISIPASSVQNVLTTLTLMVNIAGSIFFTEYYSSEEILAVLEYYLPTISVSAPTHTSGYGFGSFVWENSNSTNTTSSRLSIEPVTLFTCIPVISK